MWTFLEVAVIVAAAYPSSSLSQLVLTNLVRDKNPQQAASHIRVTPVFLIGWFFAVIGGSIRLWCYRTLARLFTFELTIRNDHKLVTSGPYSYARHPSYTALIMAVLGYSYCHLTRGSWLRSEERR